MRAGCGKSTIALSILGLLDGGRIESGEILFEGQTPRRTRGTGLARDYAVRRIGFVFQDARSSLNPVLTVGQHFEETLRAHSE